MIYFDNAATGGFKPRAVTDTAYNVIKYLCANPGRSGHRLSLTGAKGIYDCRISIGEFFNATPERVIFTKNCTEALNLAIFGCLGNYCHVITTVFEHNSVLRPLTYLHKKGKIKLDIVSPSSKCDLVGAILSKITDETGVIVMTALSNVTGEIMPFERVGRIAKEKGITFIVDGAQAGGHIQIDLKKNNISMLALAGHKGLYGIMGSGILVINDNVEIEPLMLGGTGSESFNLNQPRCYPERLESGTVNLPAIFSLNEGVKYIKDNLECFSGKLTEYTAEIIQGLESMNIKCYSKPNPAGIVSFLLEDISSDEVADILNSEYDIAVRGGMHCAPLTHKFLSTEKTGLVRASLAVQNTSREISAFLNAVKRIKG